MILKFVVSIGLALAIQCRVASSSENHPSVRGKIHEVHPFTTDPARRLSYTGHCTFKCAPDPTQCTCSNCCTDNLAQPNLETTGCTSEGYKYELVNYFLSPDADGISTFTYKATYCNEPPKDTGGLSHWGIIAGSCSEGSSAKPTVLKLTPNTGKCCASSKDSCSGGTSFDNTDPTCSKDLGYRTAKCDAGFTSGEMYLTFSIKGVTGVGPSILAAKHAKECYYYCIMGPSCSALGLSGVTVKCADPETTTEQNVSYTIRGGKPGGASGAYTVDITCSDTGYAAVHEDVSSSGPWPHTKRIPYCETALTIKVDDNDAACPAATKEFTAAETPVCCHDDYGCKDLSDKLSPYKQCTDVIKDPFTNFADVFTVNTATACHQSAGLTNEPMDVSGSFCANDGAAVGEKTYTIKYHNDKTPQTCSQTWTVQCDALLVKDLKVECFEQKVHGEQRATYTIVGGQGKYDISIACSNPASTTSVSEETTGTFKTNISYCAGSVTVTVNDANKCVAVSSQQASPENCCSNEFVCKPLPPIAVINGCNKDAGKDKIPSRLSSDVFHPNPEFCETGENSMKQEDSYSSEPYNFCSGVTVTRTYMVTPHNYAGDADPQSCSESWTVQDTEAPTFIEGPCTGPLSDIILDCKHNTLAAPLSCKAKDNCVENIMSIDPTCCADASGLHYKWTATDGCHEVSVAQNVGFPTSGIACASSSS